MWYKTFEMLLAKALFTLGIIPIYGWCKNRNGEIVAVYWRFPKME